MGRSGRFLFLFRFLRSTRIVFPFKIVSAVCAGYGRLFVGLRLALAAKGLGLRGGIRGAKVPRVAFPGDTRPTWGQNYHRRGESVQRKGRDGGAGCADACLVLEHGFCKAPPTSTASRGWLRHAQAHEIKAERNVRDPILDER